MADLKCHPQNDYRRNRLIAFKEGKHNSRTDNDVRFCFELQCYPNENNFLNLEAGFGVAKITFKSQTLSLAETIALRDALTEMINRKDEVFAAWK